MYIVSPVIGWTLLIASCGAAATAAVTAPITATLTRTIYEVGADGKTTVVDQRTGTFRRASDGSEVTIMHTPSTDRPNTETLTSNGQRVVVKHFNEHSSVQPAGRFAPFTEPFVQNPVMASETIDGLYTVVTPVFDSKTYRVIGKRWFSPDFNIDVRRETQRTSTVTGRTIRTVEEMSNIRVGF
jgi:hypothetical protein